MKIRVKIGGGKAVHAADYNQETKEIKLFCDSLKYERYFAYITDYTTPTASNVTCSKCSRKGGY